MWGRGYALRENFEKMVHFKVYFNYQGNYQGKNIGVHSEKKLRVC